MARVFEMLNGLSLRRRFLITPLLVVILLAMLVAAFTYESERQDELLTRLANLELAVSERVFDIFIDLSSHHIALHELLLNAGKSDEETVYVEAKGHLNGIHEAILKFKETLVAMDHHGGDDTAIAGARNDLLQASQAYLRDVTSSIEIATVNLALAPAQITLANKSFIDLQRAFDKLFDLLNSRLTTKTSEDSKNRRFIRLSFAAAGIAISVFLLFLSYVLARLLSNSIEAQIRDLAKLGNGLGADARPAQSNEIASIQKAIAIFKGLQAELRDSEVRFRQMFENMSDCAVVYQAVDAGEDFTFIKVNAATERVEGLRQEEMIGKRLSEVFPGVQEMGLLAVLQRVWRSGQPEHYPMALYSDRRIQGWREGFAYRLASGEVVVIYVDVTARRQAEEELRIAAAAFQSKEPMLITDANEVILRVNHAFVMNTGYTAEEAVGQTPRILKSGRHDADFYRTMWEKVLATGGWTGEVWDRRRNGEIYPKWLTISAVRDPSGKVTHYIGTHLDVSERKKTEQKVENLAFFDQLTGVPNRTLLMDRLKQSIAASLRSKIRGALFFIDLDHFKKLNDTLGHALGDQLLKQVAGRLVSCVREGDTVARLGGDEFVVLLAGLSKGYAEAATKAELAAQKILASLNQSYMLGGVAYHSAASIGITVFGGESVTIDELMMQADLAMYKSKEAGRNTLCFFDPNMESAMKERTALEDDLRMALDAKEFLLHYQSQLTDDGCVVGVEVLVRWRHPQRGLVPPDKFIPLAEEVGLILPLGRWVLETACMQLATWAAHPTMSHLTVAVNVSAKQFRQVDFVAQVREIIEATGANPQRLKIELTESMLVENVEDIIAKMSALKGFGVSFSLDDFGTGYSSLAYLKRLPLDQLKIDRSFVRDILTNPNDAAIARTIVALSQSLGLTVIAEGVETKMQRDMLVDLGCHTFQGYFFSRPLGLSDFGRYMEGSRSVPEGTTAKVMVTHNGRRVVLDER